MYIGSPEIIHYFKDAMQSGIYIVSSNLLYPVIIILLGLITWSLIELGSFIFEWHSRHRNLKTIEKCAFEIKELLKTNDAVKAGYFIKKTCSNYFLHEFIDNLFSFQGKAYSKNLMQARIEKLLQDCDTGIEKRLEKSRFVAKAAPMFGLMGTLIPMGPALLGLAQGDTKMLSDNLIIAFGTTVIGLMAGVISYLISIVRTRWYAQDISDIEYFTEILFDEPTTKTPVITAEATQEVAPEAILITTQEAIPKIGKNTDKVQKNSSFGIVKTFSRFIYFDLIFTSTSIILAKTTSNILTHPLIFILLSIILNSFVILAHTVGYTVLPLYLFLIIINALLLLIFITLKRTTIERADKKSRILNKLSKDDIINDDPDNIEVNYSDILEINISRSIMKILTNNGWIEVGRMLSNDYMDIIESSSIESSSIEITIGDKT